MEDVIAMKASNDELQKCLEWVLSADGGEHWPAMVKESFLNLEIVIRKS